MPEYHICGMNLYGFNLYKFLKKKKIKVTISDIKEKKKILKKFLPKNKRELKDFYFSSHPKKIIKNAHKVIISPGIIKDIKSYNFYNNKKFISEIDIFFKFSKWKPNRVIFVSGSRGKTTLCRKIINSLRNLNHNVYYMDRKRLTLSSIPDPKKNDFLVAEVDCQMLLLTRGKLSGYRIFTNFFYDENKSFASKEIYLNSKKILFNFSNKAKMIIADKIFVHRYLKNIKNLILVKKYKNYIDTNNMINNLLLEDIKKNEKLKICNR